MLNHGDHGGHGEGGLMTPGACGRGASSHARESVLWKGIPFKKTLSEVNETVNQHVFTNVATCPTSGLHEYLSVSAVVQHPPSVLRSSYPRRALRVRRGSSLRFES